jgi:predicted nucleotidyltransferase
MGFDFAAAKKRLVRKENERRENLHEQYCAACRDFSAIVKVLIEKYHPVGIFQWGSLLDEKLFWEHSDIDIGIEGIRSALEHAAMQADAEQRTDFPVDLVNMDRIEPLYADEIRKKGRKVYGRQ